MGRPTCCCSYDQISTLRKVDASGQNVWSVNHYSDWPGGYTAKGTTPWVGYSGASPLDGSGVSNHQARLDEHGNFYQIGGPSYPIDPIKTNPQTPVESLRKYNSDGIKQWGWSHQPTGNISGTTRTGPINLESLMVTAGGTSIVWYPYVASIPGRGLVGYRKLFGVDADGNEIWQTSVEESSIGEFFVPLSAGNELFIVKVESDYPARTYYSLSTATTGKQLAVFSAVTGELLNVIAPKTGSGASARGLYYSVHLVATISKDDSIFIAWDSDAEEREHGSGILRKVANATTGENTAEWETPLLYIRSVATIAIDPTGEYLMVSGARNIGPGGYPTSNPSYANYAFYTEIYKAATGEFVRVLLVSQFAPTFVTRHAQPPIDFGNGWLIYQTTTSYEIWTTDPTGDVPESLFATWTYEQNIGGFSEAGESAWYSAPQCTNSLVAAPDCGSTYTYAAESDGGGGFRWIIPSSTICAGGCYLPTPAIDPTSLDDTFTTTCRPGIKCTGHVTYTDILDAGPSIPIGYPTRPPGYYPNPGGAPYYTNWNVFSPTVVPDCADPCYQFGAPSKRGAMANTVPSQSITVLCE